jgi:hypothetical protein
MHEENNISAGELFFVLVPQTQKHQGAGACFFANGTPHDVTIKFNKD